MAEGSEHDVAGAGVRHAGAPHGITLFDHAEISAEIAEAARPQADILEAHGLTEAQWNEASIFWMTRIGQDVREHGEDARIPQLYSDAFSKAQDALKPPPAMDAATYAKLVVDIQAAGGPAQPLAARSLSLADYLRLSRHMARLLSTDPAQAKTFSEAYQRLQPTTGPAERPDP
ncbi:hypothetical protein [Sorangium cellulosum]|uniref:Uncharacterized protein n=1 Tax=Sorangium cellulosum So0157-2 TaxID=1254432 RepID=S4XTH9_SORCE|nr:hypothetical protein [Sorangium cellulosum]AGP36447.1 hypothetical protein SCE1572_19295 [Sorangium cellulosum So0157-2]